VTVIQIEYDHPYKVKNTRHDVYLNAWDPQSSQNFLFASEHSATEFVFKSERKDGPNTDRFIVEVYGWELSKAKSGQVEGPVSQGFLTVGVGGSRKGKVFVETLGLGDPSENELLIFQLDEEAWISHEILKNRRISR